MTDDHVRKAEQALDAHGAFERDEAGFAVTTTPFDAKVQVSKGEPAIRFQVTVQVPSIDAAVVEDETVAPVVREGWFETFERRLEDLGGALRGEPSSPMVSLRPASVVVESTVRTSNPVRGVSDAKALVDYVEGTYVEGIIPGYTYRPPVAGLLDRAAERSGAEHGRPPL